MYRGIQALRSRRMTPTRTLFLPIVFFVWAIASITAELQRLWLGYIGFVIGLVFGFVIGWALWRNTPAVFDPITRTIERPGSPWTLILILLAFITKFVLHVCFARSPILVYDYAFNLIYGGTSGLFDGVFWGGTFICLQALRARQDP